MRTVIPWCSMTNIQELVVKFDLVGMIDDDESVIEASARTIAALGGAEGEVLVRLLTLCSPADVV